MLYDLLIGFDGSRPPPQLHRIPHLIQSKLNSSTRLNCPIVPCNVDHLFVLTTQQEIPRTLNMVSNADTNKEESTQNNMGDNDSMGAHHFPTHNI